MKLNLTIQLFCAQIPLKNKLRFADTLYIHLNGNTIVNEDGEIEALRKL